MAKQNLLLVDADPRSLRVLEVSLRKAGYSVATCIDAKKALEMVEYAQPDLIISDTRLPVLDGFGFVTELRKLEGMSEVPFIFLSSDGSVESKVRGLELGVEDYLTKPIYIKEIITRVNLVLQRRARAGLERRTSPDSKTRFSGSLSEMGLVDILQTIDISRKSGVLYLTPSEGLQNVSPGETRGAVYFDEGQLVHAELNRLFGEAAIYRFLIWNEGTFDLEFRAVRVDKRTITVGIQGILMEGMRRIDEWGRMLEQLPDLASVFTVNDEELLTRLAEIPDEINAVLKLFDGTNSMMDVVDLHKEDDLATLSSISKLYFEGLIVDSGRVSVEQSPVDLMDPEDFVPGKSERPPPANRRAEGDTSAESVPNEAVDGAKAEKKPQDTLGTDHAATLETPGDSGASAPEENVMSKKGKRRRREKAKKVETSKKAEVIQFPKMGGEANDEASGTHESDEAKKSADKAAAAADKAAADKAVADKAVADKAAADKAAAANKKSKTKKSAAKKSDDDTKAEKPQAKSDKKPKNDPDATMKMEPTKGKKKRKRKGAGKAEKRTTSSQMIRAITSTGEHPEVAADFFSAEAYEKSRADEVAYDPSSEPTILEEEIDVMDETWRKVFYGVLAMGAIALAVFFIYRANSVQPVTLDPTTTKTTPTTEQTPTPAKVIKVEEVQVAATEPEVAEPEVAVAPEVVEPEVAEPEVAEPEVAVAPEVVEPEVVPEPVAEVAEPAGDYAELLAAAKKMRGKKAIEGYKAAIAANPNGAEALGELAVILVNRGKNKEAIEYAEKATSLDPTNSKAWIYLGAALQATRDKAGAKEAYQSCVDRGEGRYVAQCRQML